MSSIGGPNMNKLTKRILSILLTLVLLLGNISFTAADDLDIPAEGETVNETAHTHEHTHEHNHEEAASAPAEEKKEDKAEDKKE